MQCGFLRTAILACALLLSGTADVRSQETTPPAPAPAAAKSDVEMLVSQGLDTLCAQDYTAARDLFDDALTLDKENPTALRGGGQANLYLKNVVRAREMLEKKVVLAAKGGVDRALAIDLCSACLADTPMRGVIYAKDYLYARFKDPKPDEEMLNVFATCLNAAWYNSHDLMNYKDCEKFYVRYLDKLEATRPGERRWGAKWYSANDVENKLKSQMISRSADAVYTGAISDISREIEAKKRELAANAASVDPKAMEGRIKSVIQSYTDQLAKKKKDYLEAYIMTHGTDFPTTIDPVPLFGFSIVGSSQQPSTEPGAPPVVQVRRRVIRYAAAFAIAPDLLVTPRSVVENNPQTITVRTRGGKSCKASIVQRDEKTGLALLRIKDFPLPALRLSETPMVAGDVSCVGFPVVSVAAAAPQLLAGVAPKQAEDMKVKFLKTPRLTGCPLLQGGKVVGIAVPERDTDPKKIPLISVDQLRAFLAGQEIPKPGADADPLDATVLVTATKDVRE